MKFNALVVAAMVIASVNAGLINQPPSGIDNSGDKSVSSPPSNSIEAGEDEHIRLKLIKKDPKCDIIVAELRTSLETIRDLDIAFLNRYPKFMKLMIGNGKKWEDKKMGEDGDEKDKKHALRIEARQKWTGSHPVAISGLQEFKKRSISLKKGHGKFWKQLKDNKCSTEGLKQLSPEYMKK
ncbi:hypothetical protein BASA61_003326 [Batrachochytrium salamandrivorans]|nr:hypothetical protein BASA62_007661 [Batrachochytrium salamandrivorans]KAH6596843.1 hypothetical protein BASA61_003326 [Batrachochytrium salamandrivorans]